MERFYPQAYDRLALGIAENKARTAVLVEQLQTIDAGLQLLIDGVDMGGRALRDCDAQAGHDDADTLRAGGYVDEALSLHPGAGSEDTKAAEAYKMVVAGNEELEAEHATVLDVRSAVTVPYRRMVGKSQSLVERKGKVGIALRHARLAISSWEEADADNQQAIAARTAETVVLNGAGQNIAEAKEKLKPPVATTATSAEAVTPATAAAKLKAANDAIKPLPDNVQHIRTAVGAALTAYGEADKTLNHWDPNVYGPIPAELVDLHSRMGMLAREIGFVLTAQQAQEQAAQVTTSHEALEMVELTASDGQSLVAQVPSRLDDAAKGIKIYKERGYD